MTREVEAVYEKGMLRPLEPLPLAEHQHVKVTVSEISGDPLAPLMDQNFLEEARREVVAAGCVPTHEEVRRMTAGDSSCWSEAILADRQAERQEHP
jgi:predicted DNA-binding antitoxin AbrB/MazE fold protein